MQATAEIQAIPIGSSVSVRKEVERVVAVLREQGLIVEPHASGTDVEGDLQRILDAVQAVHETLHREGAVRLITNIKIETRTDKAPTLAGKRLMSG